MSDKITLFYDHDTNDDRPLPERIVDAIGGTLDYIDTPRGERFYCVRDWVYWISGSIADNRDNSWVKLQNKISKKGNFNLTDVVQSFEVKINGEQQEVDFAREQALYQITQRMSDKSATVRAVKKYLSDAGVNIDATHRRIEKYKRLGHSEGWIEERIKGVVDRKRFMAALKHALIKFHSDIYRHATEEVYQGIWNRTTEELRQDLGMGGKKITPRDHMGEFALFYTRIAEKVCTKRLEEHDKVPYWLAIEIVKDVAKLYSRQAKETSEALGIDLVTGKPLLGDTPSARK